MSEDRRRVELSLVVPMHNEEPVLDGFFARCEGILEGCCDAYEIICVDDGSRDGTLAGLLEHRARNPRVRVVQLSRNFGKEAALTAGLDRATMRLVVPIDADLQDPPELIPDMVERWKQGFDMVYGTRVDRSQDHWLKRTTAEAFYSLYNALSDVPIPANTGDFRLMDRRVLEAVRLLGERNRFMKGLFSWVGYRSCSLGYLREERAAGESKWNYWRLWNFALDGLTASTTLPLRLASYFGLLVSVFAFLYFVGLLAKVFYFGRDVPGYASIMLGQLLLGGAQLMALGVIGEYVGRVYQESKRRPLYLVDAVDGEAVPPTRRDSPADS